MMNDFQPIKAAIERRFTRIALPTLPPGPWAPTTSLVVRPQPASRGFVYASAVLGALVLAGLTAQASGTLRASYEHFMGMGSTKPLPPMIHRDDRLTIAQAQQRLPFPIVVPVGLPEQTVLQYASVAQKASIPVVELFYQTKIRGRYYRIIIDEMTALAEPPIARFDVVGKGKDGRMFHHVGTIPIRRWNHGDLIMLMIAPALPAAAADRIVRENTL